MSAALVDNREAWLESRRRCITATDVSAIVGLHPYKTAHEVYLEKVGLKGEIPQNDAMRTGTDLEPHIAQVYADRFGVEVVKADFVTHPDHPELGCTPDYYIGTDTVLEIKWVGMNAAQNFGREETDELPNHYLCQVQWQCFITGRQNWVLYVLGPWGFREYKGKHNQEMTRRLAFQALKFWGEYITAENPPPLSGATADTEYVNMKAPYDDGSLVQATDEIEGEVSELGNLLQKIGELEFDAEGHRNRIKDFMGEAQVLKTDCAGNFYWKKGSDRKKINWQAVSEFLLANSNLDEDQYQKIVEQNTTTTEGPRVFRTPFKTSNA